MVTERQLFGWTLRYQQGEVDDYSLDILYCDCEVIGAYYDGAISYAEAALDLIDELRGILRRNPRYLEDCVDV